MIDPYELLGVTIYSTLKEVKTSFYNLSLILHPDRGGTCEEMIVLQSSYDWIKNQLTNVENNKKDYQELLESYSSSNIKTFSEIFDEIVFDTVKFNQDFEKESKMVIDGYSEYNDEEYKEFNETDIVCVYSDPNPIETLPISINVKKIEDYSLDKPIMMMDYKQAFMVKPNFSDTYVKVPNERTFDEIVKEREEMK